MRNKIALFPLTVILLVTGGVLLASFDHGTVVASDTVPSKEWPSFTLIYEDWRIGENREQPTIQVVKVTYRDKWHWRAELIDHNTATEAIGTWGEYNGKEMIGFDPRTGEISVLPQDLPEGSVYVPDEWLRPHFIPKLLSHQNIVQLDATDEFITMLVTDDLPCQEPTEAMLQAGIKPCSSDNRLAERKVSYRIEDFIPTLVVDSVDGVEVHRITVKALVIQSGSE